MQATPEQISRMLSLAAASPSVEVCGLLLDSGRVWPARNIAAAPADQFELDPVDVAAAQQLGAIVGIWHSHPSGTAEPSLLDRAMCERTALPWHVVSPLTGDYRYLAPGGWQAPYEGRSYVYGVFDCWELVRDWYRQELGHALPRLDPAPDGWWQTRDLVPELCRQAGLQPVTGDWLRGDVLLCRCELSSAGADHAAVWLGDGRLLHQLRGQASRAEGFGRYWQRAVIRVVRLS